MLIERYLREITGQQPTEDDCEELLLEARLAEHIHFFVHRAIFFGGTPACEFFAHAHRLAVVVAAVRSSKTLRRYVMRGCVPEGQPAIQVDQRQLKRSEASGAAWCWWGDEQLAAAVELATEGARGLE